MALKEEVGHPPLAGLNLHDSVKFKEESTQSEDKLEDYFFKGVPEHYPQFENVKSDFVINTNFPKSTGPKTGTCGYLGAAERYFWEYKIAVYLTGNNILDIILSIFLFGYNPHS